MKTLKEKIDKIKKDSKKAIKKLNSKIKLDQNRFNSLELILIFVMALLFGILLGEMIFSSGDSNITKLTKKTNENITEIESVYNTVLKEYINKVDEEKLKEAAIQGMMSVLGDTYSNYYDKEKAESFNEELEGYFIGIGTEIYKEDGKNITINRIFENSPAEKVGLKKGDEYLKIDGIDVTKKEITEVAEMIKEKNNKIITLTVKRGVLTKTVKLTTSKIEMDSVTSKIIEKNNKKIGYISISIFASNTDEQFEEHLKTLEEQKINKLIIDVRSNSGGNLESVINIASNFLTKKDVILEIVSKNKVTKKYSIKDSQTKYEVVVLINGGSASGSEVLASALNENINAKLVGTTTFGKGTVQKTKTLTSNTMIKYTSETWRTSKSKEINEVGVKPTIEVKLNKNYYETLNEKDDNQYQKAIEVLLK